MSLPPMLLVYRGATTMLGPFAGLWLAARTRSGKEDRARIGERYGRYPLLRPAGTLVWLHAASVGESGVALQLVEALAARDPTLSFLLSTGTRTSAELVARRSGVRTQHVYAPLDRPDAVERFIAHWRPDVGVFVESELWPNLILAAQSARVPLALVNARMSPTSLRRLAAWRATGLRLLNAFDFISAADARTSQALARIAGRRIASPGNLKLAAPAPPAHVEERAALASQIGARPVWLAASTHAGEDEIVLAAHRLLRAEHADALLLIAPRHPERGEAVAALAGGAPRRALGQPVSDAPVYIADTLGELGLFYSLVPTALVAGSLLPHLKGHNPVEPAKLGAAILTGPHVESFGDLFAELVAAGGARIVEDAPSLAQAVSALWRDEEARARQCTTALDVVDRGAHALEETANALLALTKARRAHASA